MKGISRRTVIKAAVCSSILPIMPRQSSAQVEPVTAGLVGLALLKGAISYVGGQLMALALGGAKITDVQTWIQLAVAELEAFISSELRRQLDEKVIESMRADLQAVIIHMDQYSNLGDQERIQNRYLLEQCDAITARLVPLALNYDQALFIASVAFAYRLITIQALYASSELKDHGYIIALRSLMDDFAKKFQSIKTRLSLSMSPQNHVSMQCSGGLHGQLYCWIVENGVRDGDTFQAVYTCYGGVHHNVPPCKTAQQIMAERIGPGLTARSAPYAQRQSSFDQDAGASINLAVSCYSEMCAEIGGTYVSPVSAGSPVSVLINRRVSIPGAIINPSPVP